MVKNLVKIYEGEGFKSLYLYFKDYFNLSKVD